MSSDEQVSDRDPQLEALAAGLKQLVAIVGANDLEPSPERGDWAAQRGRVDEARRLALEVVLPGAEAVLAGITAPEEGDHLRNTCADVVGDAAGLLYAARERDAAATVLAGAARVGQGTEAGALAAEGVRDMQSFCQIIRAWWLFRHDRRAEARTLARGFTAMKLLPTIAASAQRIVDAPEPLKQAPSLFTFNGIGVGVLGERDARGDGTYVTTRYAKLIYIPIFPIDAYRVARGEEEGSYYFLHREPLSRAARIWRWVVLAAVLTAGIGYAVASHVGSPDYRLASAIAAAQEAERGESGADPEAQLARYEAALGDSPEASVETAMPAIEAIVRLSGAGLSEPLTVEQVPKVKRVVRRFEALPRWVRSERGAQPMVARIEALAGQLGEASEDAIDAQIRLLADARRLVESGPESQRIAARQQALRGALAGQIAAAWPLRAIRIYAASGEDPQAVAAAAALIDGLDDGPSQWLELAAEIEAWITAASRVGGFDPAVARARERLAAARTVANAPGRAALLAGDAEALRAALAAAPHDQEIAVAVAQGQRAAGDSEAASATLAALGAPGRLVLATQVALAGVWAELGRVQEAESLLAQVLIDRLPAFEDARVAYSEARGKEAERLLARARTGDLPQSLIVRLNAASEAEQSEIFSKWAEQEMATDSRITSLLAAYTAASEVVPVALALGTIQLQRASGLGGAARAAALNAAEHTFLAIQAEAEGVPSYHLGLGEVYHRLGKREEGDREFASLLDAKDPAIALEVANAYRGLGMSERARELSEKLYTDAPSPIRERAAMLRSLLARTVDEGVTWVERADLNNPFTRSHLLSLEAQKLMAKGEWEQADRKLAEILKGHLADAGTQSSSANNAAVTMLQRYQCTGERSMLDEAVRTLEKSRRLTPDNAVILGNLASAVDHQASVALASTYVDVQRLPLADSEAKLVLGSLAEGRTRADVQKRVRGDAMVQRAIDLYRQSALLAPRSTSPYESEGGWLNVSENLEALRDLVARVEAVENLDASDAAAARERHLSGEDDELQRTSLRTWIGRLDLRIAKLDRRKQGPTLAAATFLRGHYLETQGYMDGAEPAVEAAAAYRLAREIWPDLGCRNDETRALALAALHRAAAASPEFASKLTTDLRRVGLNNILLGLARDPNSAATTAARATPEFGRALASLRERGDDELQLADWAIATIGADPALASQAREALTRESRGLQLRLDSHLDPGDERTRELIAHLAALTRG